MGSQWTIIACCVWFVLFLLQSLGGMSKDRLVTFRGKLESVVRFCSLVCQVMVLLLKSNSLTQEQLLTLPVNIKLGVSMLYS